MAKVVEVKKSCWFVLTPKEKFDYDSQRIQNNCKKVQCMLQEVGPLTFIEQSVPLLGFYTHIQQALGRVMGIPKEHIEYDRQAEKSIPGS